MAWILLLMSIACLLVAIYLWRRNQRPGVRLRLIEARLDKLSGKPATEAERRKILKSLFALIAGSTDTAGEPIVYKAIDLLQLAYGHGLTRPDEPMAITGLVGSLINQERHAHAAAALDTYRGLLRNLDNGQIAAEQLQTVGVMAMKAKHAYIAAKSVDILFAMFEKPDKTADPATVTAAIGALRVIGKFALKRQDHDFFRELVARLSGLLASDPPPAAPDAALVALISLWMHVIVGKQDEIALNILIDNVQLLAEQNLLPKPVIGGLLREWQDIAGIASLNPNSQIAAILICDMVKLAEKSQDCILWSNMTRGVSKVARMITDQYGAAYAFPILYPLLEESRKMLAAQVRFPLETTSGEFRQKAICSVIKECLIFAEVAARTRIVDTTYDVIEEMYRYWRDDRCLNYKIKSAKKFFQLIILYWHKKNGRQALKQTHRSELMEPLLLSQTELGRLTFMND